LKTAVIYNSKSKEEFPHLIKCIFIYLDKLIAVKLFPKFTLENESIFRSENHYQLTIFFERHSLNSLFNSSSQMTIK